MGYPGIFWNGVFCDKRRLGSPLDYLTFYLDIFCCVYSNYCFNAPVLEVDSETTGSCNKGYDILAGLAIEHVDHYMRFIFMYFIFILGNDQ